MSSNATRYLEGLIETPGCSGIMIVFAVDKVDFSDQRVCGVLDKHPAGYNDMEVTGVPFFFTFLVVFFFFREFLFLLKTSK